jgi:hypothetical protein
MSYTAILRSASHINPTLVSAFIALHACFWISVALPAAFHGSPQTSIVSAAVMLVFSLLAYTIGFALNLRVAAEYRSSPWMFTAWICFAGNCALSIVRSILESHSLTWIWPDYVRSPFYEILHQTPIAPANVFLLCGLMSLWIALRSLGLRPSLSAVDWASIALVIALLIGILVFRRNLDGVRSPYIFARITERAGLFVLTACAVVSVVLRRLAADMGGGYLARTFQFITAYTVLRAALVFAGAYYKTPASAIWFYLVCNAAWNTVPWLAASAAVSGAYLSVDAAFELEQRRAVRAEMISH